MPAFLGWIAATATGCTAETGAAGAETADQAVTEPASGQVAQAIFGGERDNDDEAQKSVVALKIGTGSVFELCTGAVIGKNVVLTARHCLSKTLQATVICDEQGQSGNGDQVGDDVDLGQISVFTGANPAFTLPATAHAKQIVHANSKVLCNQDIAVLIVDTDLNVPIAPVRLGRATKSGETVRSVGYGKNDVALPTGTRLRRDGVSILAMGKVVSQSKTPLGSHEFEVGTSTCQGDSGGPAISETTGAVVGVVSRGGECSDNFGHIYTSTAGQVALLEYAFSLAGGTPSLENGDTMTSAEGDDGTTPTSGSAAVQNHASCSATPGHTGGAGSAAAFGLFAFGLVCARRRRA